MGIEPNDQDFTLFTTRELLDRLEQVQADILITQDQIQTKTQSLESAGEDFFLENLLIATMIDELDTLENQKLGLITELITRPEPEAKLGTIL